MKTPVATTGLVATLAALGAYLRRAGRRAVASVGEQPVQDVMRALSERRRIGEALRASQALLATAESVAEVGSWDWDMVRKVTIWSPQLYRIFGRPLTAATAGREDFIAYVHPDDKARVAAALDAAIAGAMPFAMRFRIVRSDGSERVLDARCEVFRGPDGQPVRMVGTARDITAIEALERKLQESVALYRTLFEASPDAVVMWGMDARIRAANERAARMLGYKTPADLVGKAWADFLAPESRGVEARNIARAAEARRLAEAEFVMQRRDGTRFIAQGRAIPVLDAAGRPAAFIGAVRDVTEREQAAEALRTSRTMLATAESIAQIGSWQWDFATGAQVWSTEMHRITGRPATDRPPTFEDFIACVHPDDRPLLEADARAAQAGGGTDALEFRLVRPDGAERIVSVRKQLDRDAAGKPVRLTGTLHDVTEQRRRERELARLHADMVQTVGKLERRQREMLLLNELNDAMQTCNGRDEAYPLIAAAAQKSFPGTSGALAVFVNHHRELKTLIHWGEAQAMASDFVVDDCWALRRGQMHEFVPPGEGAHCRHFAAPPAGAYLCLPLVVHGEILGLLHLELAAGSRLDPDQRQLAISFGEIVKLSLSNLKMREVLRDEASHDSLTGLFNRTYLQETLTRELHRAQRDQAPLTVAMLDIDHFKMFNDTYGHEAGDEVLRAIGALLRQGVRLSDIACRYGGEEFLLVLLDTDGASAGARLQDLCHRIRTKRHEYLGTALPPVTVSAGVAQFPAHGTTPQQLIKAADDALYAAKKAGRDRIETAAPRDVPMAAAS